MLSRIFPSKFDNAYRGSRLAIWIFVPVAFVHIGISLVGILRPDGGAQSADGIPLDSFPPLASAAVVGVVASLGAARLALGVFFVAAVFRYRTMIPLLYLLILGLSLGNKLIDLFKPIARMPGVSSGGYVTWTLLGLVVLGLVLSLTGRGYSASRQLRTA